MSNRWFTLSNIYSNIQANSFLFFIRKLPLIGFLVPPDIYRYRTPKYLAGFLGIIINLAKSALAANLSLLLSVYYLPQWLSEIVGLSGWPNRNIQMILFVLIVCFVPAVYRSKIFTPIIEDHIFLNHFMMDPKDYYSYKAMKDLIISGLLLVPATAYIFRDWFIVIALIVIKLNFIAAGHVLFLFIYKKRHKLMEKWHRLFVAIVFILMTYAIFIFGEFSTLVINTTVITLVLIVEIVAIILSLRYLMKFTEYKNIAVQFANKDVVKLSISVSTGLSEDDDGVKKSSSEENQEYFSSQQETTPWNYVESVFRNRYKKAINSSYRQTVFQNLVLALIFGLLIRLNAFHFDFSNVLNYTTMVIPVVINSTFGQRYLQICFRNMDMPMLYHHFYDTHALRMSMVNRYGYLLKNGIKSVLSLIVAMLIFIIMVRTNISAFDFIGLCFVYALIFVIFETFHVITYYVFQPYSIDMTVKNPVFLLLTILENIFGITVLFSRANVLDLILPLIIAITILFILFLITLRFLPKTFKLRY